MYLHCANIGLSKLSVLTNVGEDYELSRALEYRMKEW